MTSFGKQTGSALIRHAGFHSQVYYSKPLVAHKLIEQHQSALLTFIKSLVENERKAEALLNALKHSSRYSLFKFEPVDQEKYRKLLYRILKRKIDSSVQELCESALSNRTTEIDSATSFRILWRESLLEHAWEALLKVENSVGRPLYSAYRTSVQNPELTTEQLMDVASLRAPFQTPNSFKLLLRDARRMFLDILRSGVVESLHASTDSKVQDELSELGLNFH